MEPKIPFSLPTFLGTEFARAEQQMKLVLRGEPASAISTAEKSLSQLMNGAPVLLVSSATHALEMMALSLNLVPGDEVIVPSFTFVSTANAFLLHGAKIAFADCDDSGNICIESVRRLIGPRTRAVIAVDYAGACPDLVALQQICRDAGILLFEDAAQGLGASFQGKPLGTFGSLSCLSFQDTKNIHCGEGGALVVNDSQFLDRMHVLRDKGTNRRQFLDGLVDKYTWIDRGSSYVLAPHSASFLQEQLDRQDEILTRRRALWDRYQDRLFGTGRESRGFRPLNVPQGVLHNSHIFAVQVESLEQRRAAQLYLNERGIQAAFHYVPLHNSPFAMSNTADIRVDTYTSGLGSEPLASTQRFADTLLRLPLFDSLSLGNVDRVALAVKEFFNA